MRSKPKSAFTLIELLVVISIIGILMAMLMPAIQMVRESARRTTCLNNLKQINTALINFEGANKKFPPGYSFPQRAMWSAYILPFLEQGNLYRKIDLDGPWTIDGSKNESACATFIDTFQCPSADVPQHVSDGQGIPERVPCNYIACASGLNNRESGDPPYFDDQFVADGMFYHNSSTRHRDLTDGSSHTVTVGEAIFDFDLWGQDYANSPEVVDHWYIGSDGFAPTSADNSLDTSECLGSTACPINATKNIDAPINDKEMCFSSEHPTGAQLFFADGHGQFVSELIDREVLRAIGSRNGKETVGSID